MKISTQMSNCYKKNNNLDLCDIWGYFWNAQHRGPDVTLCHFQRVHACRRYHTGPAFTRGNVNVFCSPLQGHARKCKLTFLQKNKKRSWISYEWLLQDTDIQIPQLVQCTVNGRDRVLSFCCSLLPFLLMGHGFYFLYSIYDYYFIDWYIYLIVYFLGWRFGKKKVFFLYGYRRAFSDVISK